MSAAPAKTVVWCQSHRAALVEQAKHWMEVGALVLPVIPVALDAERFPKSRLNRETGKWTLIGSPGERTPLFRGKAPSYWDYNGNPKLIARKHLNAENICSLWSQERIIQTLGEPHPRGYAAEIGSPIGFAILPTREMPVVDLDVKENSARLIQQCHEGGHYFETTPSGGVHVILGVKDAMASWSHKTHKGESTYTNWGFKNDPTPTHQGEVLCEGKVCLMAPTMRGDGNSYAAGPEPLNNTAASCVSDLSSGLGIIPLAAKAQNDSPTKVASTATEPRQLTANSELTEVPDIQALVGKKAKEFLAGDLSVYGDPSDDRSGVLTSIAKEIYGTENWLIQKGLAFSGSADELIALAVDCLGSFDDAKDECIEDKADRILDTVGRESCDIRDEDKRQKSYDYLTRPFRKKDTATITDATSPTKGAQPFVIRGYTAESIIFLVEETGLECAIKNNYLGTKSHLYTLAPKSYWENLYGYLDNNEKWKVSYDRAQDDLLRMRRDNSVYDPSGMRGVGVWLDEDHVVVHSGGRLQVDGKPTAFGDFESEYLYVKQPKVKGPSEEEPTDAELKHIFDLVSTGWNFVDRVGPYYVLGWVGCAFVGGALTQRPAIWKTGPTTAGKSTLCEEIEKRLLSVVGCRYWDRESTPAGIRQAVGHNAYPQIVDELESDSLDERKKVDALVSMNRGSSSGSGADVAKGNTAGTGVTYSLRNPFGFCSINHGIEKDQDANRIVLVPMKPLTDAHKAAEVETTKKWEDIDTVLAQKVMTRAVRMLPIIEANAVTIRHAIIGASNNKVSSRYAKVQAFLLAGSRVFFPGGDALMSDEEAKDFVELLLSPTTEAEKDAADDASSEHNDATQCLQHLLLHRIDVMREVRMEGHDRRERVSITVQEACGHFMRPNAIDLEELDKELVRQGIRVTSIKGVLSLVVANPSHAGAKAIFASTQWRSYQETLKREGADGKSTQAISFGGRAHRHRATVFPLTQIVDESELQPKPSPTKVVDTAKEISTTRWETDEMQMGVTPAD